MSARTEPVPKPHKWSFSLAAFPRADEIYFWTSPPSGFEDGNLKTLVALILALAAALLFAPVARADVDGAAHPYRGLVGPHADASDIVPLDDDGDDDDDEGGDDEDEDEDDDEASEPDDDEDDEDDDSSDDDTSGDDDNGSDEESGDNNQGDADQTGAQTSATPGAAGTWLWLLLVAFAAIAAGTAFVIRRRRPRNR